MRTAPVTKTVASRASKTMLASSVRPLIVPNVQRRNDGLILAMPTLIAINANSG